MVLQCGAPAPIVARPQPLRSPMPRCTGGGRYRELVHLDVGGLEHRPPFLNLGFLPGAERLPASWSFGGICNPRFSSCLRTAGSVSASTAAALSFVTISLGVPFGTQRPDHSVM